MATRSKRTRGITLPWERRGAWLGELLAVRRWKLILAGIVLLVAAVWVWRVADRQARLRATRAAIGQTQEAVTRFRDEMGRCPRSITELVHPPRAGARLLREIPTDGWGRPLWVRCPGRRNPDEADVVSAGPSGSFLEDDNVL